MSSDYDDYDDDDDYDDGDDDDDVWPSVSFDMEWVTSNWRQGG